MTEKLDEARAALRGFLENAHGGAKVDSLAAARAAEALQAFGEIDTALTRVENDILSLKNAEHWRAAEFDRVTHERNKAMEQIGSLRTERDLAQKRAGDIENHLAGRDRTIAYLLQRLAHARGAYFGKTGEQLQSDERDVEGPQPGNFYDMSAPDAARSVLNDWRTRR